MGQGACNPALSASTVQPGPVTDLEAPPVTADEPEQARCEDEQTRAALRVAIDDPDALVRSKPEGDRAFKLRFGSVSEYGRHVNLPQGAPPRGLALLAPPRVGTASGLIQRRVAHA